MKATDLMVGDWVICLYYPDKPYYMQFGVGDFAKCGFEFCDPIPLTAKILEKNGFVLIDEVHKYYRKVYAEGILINADFRVGEPWVSIHNKSYYAVPRCLFVHQLQHALRLFGIDKEIVI